MVLERPCPERKTANYWHPLLRGNQGENVRSLLYLRHSTVHVTAHFTRPSPRSQISQVLRKVFASSDRKRPTNQTASAPHNVNEPVSPTSLQRDGGNRAGGDCDHMKGTLAAQQLDDNTGDRRCSTEEEDHENMLPERNYQQRNEVAYKIPKAPGSSEKAPAVTATAPSSTTNEPAWNFDRFLEEQRRKEIKHDDEKEKIFQKVRNDCETYVRTSQHLLQLSKT